MPQTPHQRKASDRVAAWLAHHEKGRAWLIDQTGLDPGTVGDFLNAARWPKVSSQGKIEKALGWPAGSICQIGHGADPGAVGAVVETPGYVASPGLLLEESITNAELYRLMLAMRAGSDRIEAAVADLSRRVADLEQPRP